MDIECFGGNDVTFEQNWNEVRGNHADRGKSIQGQGRSKPRGRRECAGATRKPLGLEISE